MPCEAWVTQQVTQTSLHFRIFVLTFSEQSEERLHGIEREIGNIGSLIQERVSQAAESLQSHCDTKFEQTFQMLRSLQTENEGFGGIAHL